MFLKRPLRGSRRPECILLKGLGISLCMLLFSCSGNNGTGNAGSATAEQIIQASLDATGPRAVREKVVTLIALADCRSLKGTYTTETQTDTGGYSYFKQVFHFRQNPFEAVVFDRTQSYLLGDSVKPLGKEAAFVIRGHDFHNIILDIRDRFHHFEEPMLVEMDSAGAYQLKAKDEMNHDCTLFFDLKTRRLAAFHFHNPADEKEIIRIKFSRWKNFQGLQLPAHVEIQQGGKPYIFDFTSIVVNSPDFKRVTLKN